MIVDETVEVLEAGGEPPFFEMRRFWGHGDCPSRLEGGVCVLLNLLVSFA